MAVDVRETARAPDTPIWLDSRYRAIFFQVVLLVIVLGFGAYIFHNTYANLERRGIASGFGFLGSTAGFDIIMHLVPYSAASSFGQALLVGLLNTLVVAGIGIVFATMLGFVIGVARLSRNWLIARLAAVYIEGIRNIPLLLQIIFWYQVLGKSTPGPRQSIGILGLFFINNRGLYMPAPVFQEGFWLAPVALAIGIVASIVVFRWARARQVATGQQFPILWTSLGLTFGLPLLALIVMGMPFHWDYPELQGFNFSGGMVLIPEFISLTFALVVYTAAFIGETVRAGIMAVSHGQTEAAYALGLRPGPTLRLVIIPQAMRVIIPPMTSQYLNLTKNSSLATAIAYPDLVAVFAGTVLNQTGQAVECIAITMAVYLTTSLTTSVFMNWFNTKMALRER
ncbi:MAG: amino acid ABC transporter permease [Alphaproteobacteria bacterium]|nr:amino acid ABC transporter permease [Alphaproteobacteria bacterium]